MARKLCEAPYRVYGVAVSAGEPEKIERAKRIANEAAARLRLPERLELADLVTDQNFIGEGYGIPTEEALEAIALLARTRSDPAGSLLHVESDGRDDPTTFADGEIRADETVVFLHTGGMPALFTADFVEALSGVRDSDP